ncbi:MAG TPA: NADH-quinone oxidoreductase subunit G [Gammaproteobacteria bacterium]|nr:NADH-quinone oxidoreductase subunit G [Gammaproteobacteria bacterium]
MADIEINGKTIKARDGAMVIEAADEAGITIPRFCYHKKLSIAASCRMCLVEVEKAPKPLPACATPVTDGMKVWTNSPRALAAQKNVMEFLLINHPLDCPICDQGGECDLQDIAVGYGNDVSRFAEIKRVVKSKDIGPLIATDFTRCIHCTRCVRFGQEIAGIRELGATGRGEHMEIGTYVEKSVSSELSGNIIDLCPVGSLTSKPFRFTARPWELTDSATVAPHDCVGSNLTLQTRRNRVMRAVPRTNEAINETWISDRDRFSYIGLNSEERLKTPMIKVDGEWRDIDWNTALEQVVKGVRRLIDAHGADQIGALVSPSATLEEMYLLQKLVRALGCANIDHRLRQSDFSDQDLLPPFPWLGQNIEQLEKIDAALLIGSNVRKEQPIIGHRLRKAAVAGANVMTVNPVDYPFNFPVAEKLIGGSVHMVRMLSGVAKALLDITGETAPEGLVPLLENISVSDTELAIAEKLKAAENATVLLGVLAQQSPQLSSLRALSALIAKLSGACFGELPEGANGSGGWLAGAVPHRGPVGQETSITSLVNASVMLEHPLRGYLLMGVEPELDSSHPLAAAKVLNEAEFVVSFTSFVSEQMKQYADVLLPISPFSETSGTFVNIEGSWQSFAGAVAPLGESRPAWKILRVLGNLFDLKGFDYTSSDQVRDELKASCGQIEPSTEVAWRCPADFNGDSGSVQRIGEVPIYATDALVRRSDPLQQTQDAAAAAVYIKESVATSLGLVEGDVAQVMQGGGSVWLPVVIDERVADGCAVIPAALPETAGLGAIHGPVDVSKN